MVINLGKTLSGDWGYVETEVRSVCDEAHARSAKVKVILETDFLVAEGAGDSCDELKQRLCEICERAGADWVKTSTGFGFVKQSDGSFNYEGATERDVALMRAVCSATVQVKASGGIRSLDDLIRFRDLGATRCGTSSTSAILSEYERRRSAVANGYPSKPEIDSGVEGY
jgi:deoxyribose-phosphate aldolase